MVWDRCLRGFQLCPSLNCLAVVDISCMITTGSETAPERNATTAMLDSWDSVLRFKGLSLHLQLQISSLKGFSGF